MNLLSSLVLSSSLSSSLLSLSLSSLSVSLCLCVRVVLWSCCCGVVWCVMLCCVVLCLVLWCGVWCGVWCVVWCVVCDTLKPHVYVQNVAVCTSTTRTRVSTCARGAGIHGGRFERTHGDVLDGPTGRERFGRRQPHVSHR